jgi:hypothetical protein
VPHTKDQFDIIGRTTGFIQEAVTVQKTSLNKQARNRLSVVVIPASSFDYLKVCRGILKRRQVIAKVHELWTNVFVHVETVSVN